MSSWTCISCGGENPEGMKFCGHCGAAAGDGAAASAAPATPAAEPSDSDVHEALRSFVAAPVADRLVEAGGRLPEERRLITALFADISGFTPLATRLEPEALQDVIDPVILRLCDVVAFYGGYIEKFAGDALLALFGAPVAREDDPHRALLAAADMHRALAELRPSLPDAGDLELHVGVNTGHVIARVIGHQLRLDYAVLGDAVVLAQRLESVAHAGETYVGELTARLTQGRFDFDPLEPLTLKGWPEVVTAYRLVGEHRHDIDLTTTPFVGRDREREVVRAAFDRARDGTGSVVAVIGDAGSGKTRLVAEVYADVGMAGVELACRSHASALPYHALLDALMRAAATIDAAAERCGLQPAAWLLQRLVAIPGPADALEAEAFRLRLHDAVADALAAGGPRVVWVDDLHWADPSTIDLVKAIALRTAIAPLVLVVTCRTEHARVLENVVPVAGIERVVLAGLDEPAVAALVTAELPGAIDPSLTASIVDRAAGNPLFAGELLRWIADDLDHSDGVWRLGATSRLAGIAPTLEGLLGARIDALPVEGRRALQLAAIAGAPANFGLLQDLAGDRSLAGGLDIARQSGLIEVVGEGDDRMVRFQHPLMQEAAYGRMLHRERRALHLHAAELLERRAAPIDVVASHLERAEAGERAVDALAAAAVHAASLFANNEAERLYRRALELCERDRALAARAPELSVALGGILRTVGRFDEARVVLAATLEAAPPPQAATGARLQLGLIAVMEGDFTAAETLLRRGLADPGSDRAGLERALALTLSNRGEVEEAHALISSAFEHFAGTGDLIEVARTMRIRGGIEDDLGRYDDACATLGEALSLAERAGNVQEIGACLLNLGFTSANRGDAEHAIECAERAVLLFEELDHPGLANAYGNLATFLLHRGALDEASARCEQAIERARALGDDYTVADVLRTLSDIAARRGDGAEASRLASEAAALFRTIGAEARADDTAPAH
jgi:class 3 adenylate cyclase/tetratricopeptide (TPR) repeat protein